MAKLSSNFVGKLGQLHNLRSTVSFQELEELIEKQIDSFNSHRVQLDKNITNLKEKYCSVLKYLKLNVVSF